jgi:hypothetical protein
MRFTHTLRWVLNDPLSYSLEVFGLTSRYFHTNLKKASEWINCRRNKFISLIIIKFKFFFSRIFGEIKKMFWHILIIPEYNFVVPIILLDQINICILCFSLQYHFNLISGVMIRALAWMAVDRGFEPLLGQIKDYEIGICFSSKHVVLRLVIRIMCLSGATCLPAACSFSKLTQSICN